MYMYMVVLVLLECILCCKGWLFQTTTEHYHGDQLCNNEYYKTYVNRLWQDWYHHGDFDVVKKLHGDLIIALNGGLYNHVNTDYVDINYNAISIHDQAYKNKATPDYSFVIHKAAEHLNIQCIREIVNHIDDYLHYPAASTPKNTPSPPTSTATTTAATTTPTPRKTTFTTAPTPNPTTRYVIITTPDTSVHYSCNRLEFLTEIVHNTTSTDGQAGLCADGTHTRSEAFVRRVCNVPETSQWKQGMNVVSNCLNIPKDTPVAMFLFGKYPIDSNIMSAVFMECTDVGFKAAIQLCGLPPKMYDLFVGNRDVRQDARNYYVIV